VSILPFLFKKRFLKENKGKKAVPVAGREGQ
jgi:hypothetical protein